ncbi:MAG: HAAS signaling domain-containing protein [Thermoguttaceae bacterium]
MDSQPWLDRVRERLARQALPPSYVQRFLEELTDHLEDLKEENMEADAISRLGEPEQVVEAAVTAYRRHSFLGRHPAAAFLVFGVSPVVSLVALIALVIVGLLVLPDGWDKPLFAGLRQFGPSASVALAYLGSLLIVVIPSIVASILYGWLARRSGISKKWILLSCTVLAVLAALPMCTAKVSAIPDENWMGLRLWYPPSIVQSYNFFFWTFCRPQQLMQFLVPLAVGLWFIRRNHGRDRLQPA